MSDRHYIDTDEMVEDLVKGTQEEEAAPVLTLEQEIAAVTSALVAEHGRKALVKEFAAVTGLGPRIFDCYRKGTRKPDKYMLYYMIHCGDTPAPLMFWADTCLDIRAKHGEGIPQAE